jgi:putative transcriptional regulator
MRTQHHLRILTLNEYVAGRLPEALSVVVASHLAWCRECRHAAEIAARRREGPREASQSALPLDLPRPGLTALKARDRLAPRAAEMTADEIGDFGLPMPLAVRLDGCSLDQITWRKVLPGVAVRDLELPPGAAGHLRLVRISPGSALPEHGHGSCELSLVLRGAYSDQHGRYTIGDIADLDSAAVHRPVADDTGPCLCLVAAETPVRYRSWLGSLWQRLTGM